MGANSPNVRLVINFLSPRALKIWLQRAGWGASAGDIVRICVIMVTKKMVADACAMCKEAGIEVDPALAALKAEEEANEDEGREKATTAKPITKGRYAMSLGMAEYIATKGCLVAVINRDFSNPPHEPSSTIGGFVNCMAESEHQDVDRHQERRQELKQEVQELQIEHYDPELARKQPQKKSAACTGAELGRLNNGLKQWRQCLLDPL